MDKLSIGKIGENKAAKYLLSKGYKILDKNYRTKSSEIDIIAQKDNTVCFVEVKTRSSVQFGRACEAVNFYKQKKIINGAMSYLSHLNGDLVARFDIIEVYVKKHFLFNSYSVNHIENAFDTSTK